jgi:hypothetical protein
MNKMKRYYCTEHSLDRRNPLKENKGLCQAAGLDGHCSMLAQFEVEEVVEMISHTPTARVRNCGELVVGCATNVKVDYNQILTGGID